MSLDQNLFTLNVLPKGANEFELVEPSGTVHYRKERVLGTVYTINLHGGCCVTRFYSGVLANTSI